jgi:hypothetical protein
MINVRLINVNDNDPFLVQCFKYYCCKNATIDKTVYDNNTKDINDYRIVAAIGYLLISDKKWNCALSDFKEGLSRISKREIKTSTLIYDQLALVGITVAIKEYKITDYYQWLHNIFFESESYCIRSSKGTTFIKILKSYFDNQNYPDDVQLKYKILIIWLSILSKEEKNTYKEQAELIQRAWKSEGYIFNELLYDGICAFLVDLLIQDKFEFELIPIEQKYKNAVNWCISIAKFWAVVITVLLISVVVGLAFYITYLAWVYEVYLNNKMWFVPLIFHIITVIGIPYGLIKNTKKINSFLKTVFFNFVMKLRRLD